MGFERIMMNILDSEVFLVGYSFFYFDCTLINFYNSCEFKINNFETLVTTRIPERKQEVAMVDDVLVNEFLGF